MKIRIRLGAVFMALIVVLNCLMIGFIAVSAHNAMLEVSYDDCVKSSGDGDDETWYILNNSNGCRHLSHTESTIKYYFAESSINGSYTWTTDVSQEMANEIKEAYANSMKKWNNVFFYSYDKNTGNIVKNKLINVVEGTENSHNLTIYPKGGVTGTVAETGVSGGLTLPNGRDHNHWYTWRMNVYVNYFYEHDQFDSDYVNAVRERNGAHELGHVLGLLDVDKWCSEYIDEDNYHHHEILMGYGSPMSARSVDITYKDIAGVAITRGFHTDEDHKWLSCGLQSDGTYKLLCSICNGVKYVNSLTGYSYVTYGTCNGNHALTSVNMMAVASYGNKDYYKCKYCRYVAPFSDNVEQDYSSTPVTGGTHHICANNVTGLSYSFLEEHTWVSGVCSGCDYEHPHTYVSGVCTGCGYAHPHTYTYKYKTGILHTKTCVCGLTSTERHFVNSSQIIDGRYATCLGCKMMLDLSIDNPTILPTAASKVSVNGSYILPNGIVVLVEEDIEAYMNGTLVFYDRDDLPTVE